MNNVEHIGDPMQKSGKRINWFSPLLLLAAMGFASQNAIAADRTGKEVVEAVCIACHGTGKDGAPKIGDQTEWNRRASIGLDQLANHATTGIRKMPAHGGQGSLSDLEMSRAIVYMATNGKGAEPNKPLSSAKALSGVLVVQERCQDCHASGKNGAPKIGDMAAWKPRINKGINNLVKSAINGHNSMPSRGGLASLSDAEMLGAVEYMISQTGAIAVKGSNAH